MRHALAAAIAIAAVFLSPALAQTDKAPRSLALAGHGEVRVAPDVAVVTLGVTSQGESAAAALGANTAAMQAVFAALKSAGVADKDVQTSGFSVQPRYDYGSGGTAPRLAGYEVANTVTVTVRRLDGLGDLLDRVVAAGSNQIHGIQFLLARPDAAADEARRLAVEDARRKAKLYAAAAGLRLGEVLSISEGAAPPPLPIRAGMLRADAAAADVPVAAGEQAVTVDINIVWEIR
jgi:hypothetical protein